MKCLIVYATREGQTRKIALKLAEHLREHGVTVKTHDARESFSLDLRDFDHFVFGASMHAGGLEKEIRDFISNHEKEITSKSRLFFLVLLSAATKDRSLREKWLQDAKRKFKEQIPVPFEELEMVAGALRYSKYSLPLKWIMKRIAEQAGEGTDMSRDYEYTDWEQVKRLAKKIISL
jgi:menaquinone-dependent protoporphyrinogen oxidase